jgi:ion channel
MVLIRALLSTAILVVLYYLIPMRGSDAPIAAGLILGLAAFTILVVWQVSSIVKSDYPGLRAVEALATAGPLFILVFASSYYMIDWTQPGAFTEALTKTDALYFAVTVFSSVGFGDITPLTTTGRVVTMVQMMGDLVVFGAVLRLITNAAKTARDRKSAGG